MLSVAHWGHEAKHKLLKKMLHIGDNVAHWGVAHWVHSVYFTLLQQTDNRYVGVIEYGDFKYGKIKTDKKPESR